MKERNEKYLLDELKKYAASDFYPLHMPGHKRRMSFLDDPYSIDITEIDGFDNLHHAEGILRDAQQRAADLYGADKTWYLINGSTCGILAAVSASVKRGGRILMARNCHKSACNAAMINNLRVSWLYPRMDKKRGICGSITPEQVSRALRRETDDRKDSDGDKIQAVFITSPTYEGVVSDICGIARAVHDAGAVLIVDEAHGAHFAMHSYFPGTALSCGADIVINSLHKTMPSLTQTALLHVKGTRADWERIDRYLDIYQSSSPSYVLMAGIDECIRLMEDKRSEIFDSFTDRLKDLRLALSELKILHLVSGDEPELCAFDFDPSKIVISLENCGAGTESSECAGGSAVTGPYLGSILRKTYHLEPEMETERHVTAIMTAADTQEGFDRLKKALLETDDRLGEYMAAYGHDTAAKAQNNFKSAYIPHTEVAATIGEAEESPHETVQLQESRGRISAESVYLYPPGIPLIVPGERIPEELPDLLKHYRQIGLKIEGMADHSTETIQCLKNSRISAKPGQED